MRAPPVTLATALVLAACTAPPAPALTPALTPALAPALTPALALAPALTPAPSPPPLLQVIPPDGFLQWGGAARTLAVTGGGCETSLLDTTVARVTARIPACWVWPSPKRDVFLAHMADGTLTLWNRDGTRGDTLAAEFTDWSSLPGRVRWSPDGTTATLLAVAPDAAPETRGVSPDGRWVAREETRGDVRWLDVVDVTTKKRVVHVRGLYEAHFSADGAYLSARIGERSPDLVVLAAGRWTEAWRRARVRREAWSREGSRLAVDSAPQGLEVLDASTMTTRSLPSAVTARFGRLYQAPDGALMAPMLPLADTDEPGHAVRVEPGGDASVVDVPREARDPGWSPDGSRMAVRMLDQTGAMSPSWRLFVADRETRERAFVDHGDGGVDLRWSSRAHRLLVTRGAALLFDADTRRVWGLPVEGARTAAIDADGERAALETSEGLAIVMLASKDRPTVLSPRDGPPATQLALAGARLAAVTHHGDVTVWNVVTGKPEATWNAGFAPENVAWVGEGRRLALSRGHVLRLSDADGSRPVTLTALVGPTGASVLTGPR
jgi:hypothetical protein